MYAGINRVDAEIVMRNIDVGRTQALQDFMNVGWTSFVSALRTGCSELLLTRRVGSGSGIRTIQGHAGHPLRPHSVEYGVGPQIRS
ncbi:MAG: hypothetical protein J07HQX50_01418 [Haloquadratum sp. J07HQX50]|nr:MAG: hypothetical protein J07HQX50_01418 [Haloquadratum sp. J07HQX50]